jgi:hypothetical protein
MLIYVGREGGDNCHYRVKGPSGRRQKLKMALTNDSLPQIYGKLW